MITVVLQAGENGEALSRSLVPLVEGAMEGVISRVMVFSTAENVQNEIDRICDLSGAENCNAEDLQAAITNAKDKWLLILEAGARLEGDWLSGIVGHMNETQQIGRFALAASRSNKPWWQSIFVGKGRNAPLHRACLMPKTIAINAVKSATSPEAMVRGRAMKVINGGRIQPAQ